MPRLCIACGREMPSAYCPYCSKPTVDRPGNSKPTVDRPGGQMANQSGKKVLDGCLGCILGALLGLILGAGLGWMILDKEQPIVAGGAGWGGCARGMADLARGLSIVMSGFFGLLLGAIIGGIIGARVPAGTRDTDREELIASVRKTLDGRTTEELRTAYDAGNLSAWSPEAFEAMRRILTERGETGLRPLPSPASQRGAT